MRQHLAGVILRGCGPLADKDRAPALDKSASLPHIAGRMHPPHRSPEIVAVDQNGAPLSCAAKNCTGDGPVTLKRWLGERDVLFFIDQRSQPVNRS